MITHTFTCDKCKTVITEDDMIQWQEKHSFESIGGFGSLFGDGCHWRVDFCDRCLYELFAQYVTIVEDRHGF